ncbi:hypothetical protein Tco_0979230, partial [Tanacetum coccineum]
MDNVVDHLTTAGITVIPGERRSIEELERMSWNLKPSEQTSVRVPSRVAVNERLNRSLSLQFKRYHRAPQPARYSVDQNDREILECLNEARALEDEPLITWFVPVGDDFPDDENTPGKVTILGESSNWDDDERNGGKILVLQEEFSRNQQDFLIEYLPQWDDQIAIEKQRSVSEWENPFVEKRGEDHTFLHISKNNDDDDNLPYLKFRNFKHLAAKIISKHEEQAFPTSTESGVTYQPLPDVVMGGLNDEQDRAYKDLDRITCKETKNLWSFLEDFRHLAIKSGKLYFPSKTEKLFAKLPPSLSKKIEESFMAKYHGLNSGVLPAIKFTHNFVSEMCKDATLAKELRDLSLCSAIPIP